MSADMASLCGVWMNNFPPKVQGPETCGYFFKYTLSIEDETQLLMLINANTIINDHSC